MPNLFVRDILPFSVLGLKIEMIGSDRALVRGRWHLVLTDKKPEGLFTLIFKRFPEGWRIVHDHTSDAPPKATP